MTDWGFSHNEERNGYLSFPYGASLTQHVLTLTESESKILNQMAQEMDMSTHSVLKQALRVLQMYRAGYLIDNSPKFGGCGACE